MKGIFVKFEEISSDENSDTSCGKFSDDKYNSLP